MVGGEGQAPLRVLQMCTTFGVGGITRHALALGAWLRGRGHQVSFAGTPGPWGNPQTEAAFLALATQNASGLGGGMAKRLMSVATSAFVLRRWLDRNPVDVIHTHESAPALVARLATLGKRIPILVTYHGSEPGRVAQFAKIASLSADRIISVSRRCGEELQTIGDAPADRVSVIGLGVKPQPKVAPDRLEALRRSLLGDDGAFLAVTIARVTEQKGIDLLVEVVREVAAVRRDIHFALVGDGEQMEAAKGWAAAAGVADRLHFVGRSEEPELYLQAADLFLLTSRWEALPFTIAEAFQAGTPAVATDCGGVAELIDDEVGRVTPIGDVAALRDAVLQIAGDPQGRAAMAAAAAARSQEDRFSPEYVHAKLEAAYRDVIKARAKA